MKTTILFLGLLLTATVSFGQAQTGPKFKNAAPVEKYQSAPATHQAQIPTVQGPEHKNQSVADRVNNATPKIIASSPNKLKGPFYKNRKHGK